MTYADQKKTPAESPHPDLQKSYAHEQLYEHSRWIRNPAIFLLSATSLLKFLILRLVILSPGPHGIHDGLQAVAKLRQGVFHPGRHLRIQQHQRCVQRHAEKSGDRDFCVQPFLRMDPSSWQSCFREQHGCQRNVHRQPHRKRPVPDRRQPHSRGLLSGKCPRPHR